MLKPMISLSPSPLSVLSFSFSLTLLSLGCASTSQTNNCEKVCRTVTKFGSSSTICDAWRCPNGEKPPIDELTMEANNYVDSDNSKSNILGKRKENDSEGNCNQSGSKKRKLQGLEITDDVEHIMKIKRSIPSSSGDDEWERAKQLAQEASLLSLYGEMLLDMAKKLRSESRELLHSMFTKPSPYPNSDSCMSYE